MGSIIIASVSAVVSIVAIVVSVRTYWQGKKEAFQNEAQKLFSQKNEFLTAYMSICSSDYSDEIKEYLLSEITSNYCNAFESACNLYLKNAIDQELFKTVFKEEIKAICTHEGISKGLEMPVSKSSGDVYKAIRDVGMEWGFFVNYD